MPDLHPGWHFRSDQQRYLCRQMDGGCLERKRALPLTPGSMEPELNDTLAITQFYFSSPSIKPARR